MTTIKVAYSGGFGVAEVTIPGPYANLSEIKAANREKSKREDNGCYFGKEEMRFFRSRPARVVVAGRFFVDSTQFVGSDGTASPRRYKVCMCDDAGNVDHVAFPPADWNGRPKTGDQKFTEEFSDLQSAKAAIRDYVKSAGDVDRPSIQAFGRTWPVEEFLGRVMRQDIGKRVYLRGGIVQVENDEQRNARKGN